MPARVLGIGRVGGAARGLRIDSKAGAGTLALWVRDASKSLFEPVTSGAGWRQPDLGRLLLRSHKAWRRKKHRGCTRKMQELTTICIFSSLVRLHARSISSLVPANGAAAATKNQGTSALPAARAASGHAATPPSSAMKSRRLMGLTQGQGSRT
jgi:hypothetical protein